MRQALLLAALLLAAAAPTTPAPGPVRVIGTQNAGCLAGAVRMPDDNPGAQTIRLSKSAYWGTPATIAALQTLGRQARQAGLPDLYLGDISDPRGGPLRGGHFSHQMGIDADVWLDLHSPHPRLPPETRETIEPASLVRPDGRAIDPAVWRPEHITLLKLAAALPRIDRILVNPAIKQALCHEVTGDRHWLRLIRPWYGHASHMHIRWQCPTDQPLCVQAPPPPPGDGCDDTLQWWFDQLDAPPKPASAPAPFPPLPAACRAIMAAP